MHGWWLASYVALWFVVLALVVLLIALAREVGTLHLRLGPRGALEVDEEGPPLGHAPPPTAELDLDDRLVELSGPGERRLLLFVSPTCTLCREVLPGLRAVSRNGGLQPVAVTDADRDEAVVSYTRRPASVVPSPDSHRLFRVPGTPYAVVLDEMGTVRAKGTVNNLEQLEGLVGTALERLATPESVH
jgi:methylamine dehydrogenase accessory protein MauD